MNALLTMIIAVTVLTALSWVGASLYDLVRNDGRGRRTATRPSADVVADPRRFLDPAGDDRLREGHRVA